jgi:AcrR family transcriptional regulator
LLSAGRVRRLLTLGEPMTKRTKRSRGRRPQVRGEPVIQRVLEITLDELARTGFAALRVEDVAQRAGVNKTTVYRRWPTKAALVRAALLTIAGDEVCVPDTGSLRSDLVQVAHQIVDISTAPQGQSVIRMILAEGPGSELGAIAQSLNESYEPLRTSLASAATVRGEVANVEEGLLLLEMLDATIHYRLFVAQVGVTPAFIDRLTSLLVSRGRAAATRRAVSVRKPRPSRGAAGAKTSRRPRPTRS